MPKSSTLVVPSVHEEQVVRRDVAMDDAERLALVVDGDVRVMQPARGVGDDAHRGAERQLDASARRLPQELDRRLPAQILERDVASVADLAGLERLDEVRVAQPLAEAPFVDEELHEVGVGRVVRQDPLDDDEPLRARVLGQKDLRHAAERERADDAVASELVRQRSRRSPPRTRTSFMGSDIAISFSPITIRGVNGILPRIRVLTLSFSVCEIDYERKYKSGAHVITSRLRAQRGVRGDSRSACRAWRGT